MISCLLNSPFPRLGPVWGPVTPWCSVHIRLHGKKLKINIQTPAEPGSSNMRMEPSPDSRDDNVNGSDTILVISKSVIRARNTVYEAREYGSVYPLRILFVLPSIILTRWMWSAVSAAVLTAGWAKGEDVWDVRLTPSAEWWRESDHSHPQLWPDSHTANTSQVQSWLSWIVKSPFHWQHSIVIPNIQLKLSDSKSPSHVMYISKLSSSDSSHTLVISKQSL